MKLLAHINNEMHVGKPADHDPQCFFIHTMKLLAHLNNEMHVGEQTFYERLHFLPVTNLS